MHISKPANGFDHNGVEVFLARAVVPKRRGADAALVLSKAQVDAEIGKLRFSDPRTYVMLQRYESTLRDLSVRLAMVEKAWSGKPVQ